jgi:hypothetical protein
MNTAFGQVYYKDINFWFSGYKTNFVVTNKKFPWYFKYDTLKNNDAKIYTDDKNSVELDLFKNMKE